jgi:hypothetical protein
MPWSLSPGAASPGHGGCGRMWERLTPVAQGGVQTILSIFGAWCDKSVKTYRAVPIPAGLL